MLEKQLLPKFAQKIIYEYLKPLSFDIPEESLMLILLIKCSKTICFNRIKIEMPSRDIFPNTYAINFLPSGGGKDAPINNLERACYGYNKEVREKRDEIYDNQKKQVLVEAKNKGLKGARLDKYIKDNQPRLISLNGQAGTPEAIRVQRDAMQDSGFGAMHFSHGEFIDFIKRQTREGREIMELLKEVYEDGDMSAKIIKGELFTKSTRGIPHTMLVHSDLTGLTTCDKTKTLMKELLGSGFARRSIVCFPEIVNVKYPTFLQEKENIKISNKTKEYINNLFIKAHKLTEKIEDMNQEIINRTIELTDEVEIAHHQYRRDLNKKIWKMDRIKDGIIVSEMKDRPFKAMRIAASIAIFRIANEMDLKDIDSEFLNRRLDIKLQITIEDYSLAADYLIESVYGPQFVKFFNDARYSIDKSDIDKMKLLFKPGVKVTKTMLRGCLEGRDQGNTKKLESAIDVLREFLSEKGKSIVEEKNGNAYYYSIISESIEQNPEEELMSTVSVGDSNEEYCVNFKTKKVAFSDLHKITGGKVRYTPAIFKGTRKRANWSGGDTLMMFDIDNEELNLTVSMVKKIFKGYKYLIVTTKRYTKEKQRYRLIFPVDPIVGIDKDEYKLMKEEFAKYFNILKYIEKSACFDCSKMWFPHNGKTYYSNGSKIINWKMFKKEKPKAKKVFKKVAVTDAKNVRKDQTFMLPNGETVGWDHFEYLDTGSTAPVHCTEPGHEDKKPSCFIARHQETGNLFFCCNGQCNLKYFNN